jgi:hypothetical protein
MLISSMMAIFGFGRDGGKQIIETLITEVEHATTAENVACLWRASTIHRTAGNRRRLQDVDLSGGDVDTVAETVSAFVGRIFSIVGRYRSAVWCAVESWDVRLISVYDRFPRSMSTVKLVSHVMLQDALVSISLAVAVQWYCLRQAVTATNSFSKDRGSSSRFRMSVRLDRKDSGPSLCSTPLKIAPL